MRKETRESPEEQAYDDFAPFYDLCDLDREPEIRFYTALLRPGDRSLLELGCGTGSILAGVARGLAGHHGEAIRVVGVDLSAGMLEVAATRHPRFEWVQGDMTEPPVQPGFDLVMCPFNSLQMLPSREDVLRTFRSAGDLLGPKGRFVFDLYNASYCEPDPASALPDERSDRVARRFTDSRGRAIEVVEDARQDPEGGFIELDWRAVDASADDRPVLARLNLMLRHYTSADIECLLHEAGLTVLERYGDVLSSPFSATGSKKQVIVCAPHAHGAA